MRILRSKIFRKHLRYYKLIFGIKSPYNVILDGNFIHTSIKFKIDIKNRFEKILQSNEVRFFILLSILKELDLVGEKVASTVEYAKRYCEVIDDSKISGNNPSDRLINFLGNQGNQKMNENQDKRKFIVATQDKELRNALNNRSGIPLIYLNKVSLMLESPSTASKNFNNMLEVSKSALSQDENMIVENIKKKVKLDEESNPNTVTIDNNQITNKPVILRKKRKAVGPNPLSQNSPLPDSQKTKKRNINKFRG